MSAVEEGAALLEIECPLCGGIVEATDLDELVDLAVEHCVDAHRYRLPAEHARAAARPVE